jgi:hypothetical protein
MEGFLIWFFAAMFLFGLSMIVWANYHLAICISTINVLDQYRYDFTNSKTFEDLELAAISYSLWRESLS